METQNEKGFVNVINVNHRQQRVDSNPSFPLRQHMTRSEQGYFFCNLKLAVAQSLLQFKRMGPFDIANTKPFDSVADPEFDNLLRFLA